MKRIITTLIVLAFAVTMPVYAATKVGTFGVPNSSGTAPLEVDSDRNVTVASDATFILSTPDINGGTIDGATIGATTPAAATFTNLTATGVITDAAVYVKSSGTYPTRVAGVGADGVVYGTRTSGLIIDGANIGANTAGTGAFTTLSASSTTTMSGNVGVGTTSTSNLLTVGSASGSQFIVGSTGLITDPAIYTKSSVDYPTRVAAVGADGVIYGTRTSGLIIDGANIGANTAGTGAFTTLSATGNVGVGSVSPRTQLDVEGNVYIGSTGLITDQALYSASAGVGTAKALCITTDGTIYGSATPCVF